MDLGSSPGEEKARELTFQLAAIERKQKEGTVGLRAASEPRVGNFNRSRGGRRSCSRISFRFSGSRRKGV